ncbi:MAG: glycosyltransferase family 2 protein [Bacteroidetes bacterium]|nr:glycosyltransferase family 2 protein [Bacteroidota bacterium]
MKFLIIIPAHNEESNIFFCLQSLEQQSFQDFDLVIVNDGSTDATATVVKNFIAQSPIKARIKSLDLTLSEHQPGAKVVRTFNKGLDVSNWEKYDIICKFDADVIFPKQYLENINQIFANHPKVGMASGIVKIAKNPIQFNSSLLQFEDEDQWIFENLSSKNHVRGPIKAYSKDCFMAMNGLRPVLGWDNIDVALAEMHGYEIQTQKDLWVKHLRPTAYKYKAQKAEKLGEYFYNLGLDLPLTIIASAKSALKNRSFTELWITLVHFFKQKHPRPLTQEEMSFIRNIRWKKMFRTILGK